MQEQFRSIFRNVDDFTVQAVVRIDYGRNTRGPPRDDGVVESTGNRALPHG